MFLSVLGCEILGKSDNFSWALTFPSVKGRWCKLASDLQTKEEKFWGRWRGQSQVLAANVATTELI